MVHLHGTESEDGQQSQQPVSYGVDGAVGVLHALHDFPRKAFVFEVVRVKLGRVAASEDKNEESG